MTTTRFAAVCALTAFVTAYSAELAAAQSSATSAGPHARAALASFETRFAVIGDYGIDTPAEAAVASLVAAWSPDFVITLGDNNYPDGTAATIDANIGKHYHAFIAPYTGIYGPGATSNRFFPSLGNHDWNTPGAVPYLAYFALPGNERYYSFTRGPVSFFALDSDAAEPDGISAASVQATWLQAALAGSTSPFKFVYFHHAPYSSGSHGGTTELRWPFRAWGADLVLAGHDHVYERVVLDGFPYLVNGLGGASITALGPPIAGSALRYVADQGAMLVDVSPDLALFRMISRTGVVADMFALPPNGVDFAETELVSSGATWKYKDDGSNQGTAWRHAGFDDSSWAMGAAQLGYGDGDESTVISFGPDPANKYITTWFRRTFTLASPASLRALRVELLRDDGAVLYLNGSEVARSNLPLGPIGHTTPATDSVGGADEDAYFGYDLPLAALVAGTNQLALELHQQDGQSSDTSFDLRLVGTLYGAPLSVRGAQWKYLDSGVAPTATWTQPAFDDSTWASGAAELGYGDGDEGTVVAFGPNAADKHITTWFRRGFSVAQARPYAGVMLRLLRDDGAVVYLNGTEVFRINLPQAAVAASTTAALAVTGADEDAFLETFVDPRLLHQGTNVLAVEIHQESGQSSDISFDLELYGL